MYHPRHVRSRSHRGTAALIATAVLVTVATISALPRNGGEHRPQAQAPAPPAAQAAPGGRQAPAATPRACTTAAAREAQDLRAAARSLSQWQVHVGAMNQLVAGRITLAQASTFWNRTRVGAQQRVSAFLATDRGVAAATARCREDLSGSGSAGAACARSVRLRGLVLAAARTAITTWQRHIDDMEMLRMGRMTGAQAARMWQRNWRKGQAQLATYQAAKRRAHGSTGCRAD